MPWWVPFIFIYCLFMGYRASKESKSPILFFIFLLLAISFFLIRLFSIPLITSFIPSIILGYYLGAKEPIKITGNTITIPGTWKPMIIIMIVFFTKFTFGWLKATNPTIALQYQHIEWIVQGGSLGLLFGRFTSFIYRYWNHRHA